MLYESLVGQCEYTTQPKGSFWCHVINTKGAVLLLIFTNEFVFTVFSFHSHLGKPLSSAEIITNKYWYDQLNFIPSRNFLGIGSLAFWGFQHGVKGSKNCV